MDAICWIPILIIAFVAIKDLYAAEQTEKSMEKAGREAKNSFKVDIINNRTYSGWIRIEDRPLRVFGWWTFLAFLNMDSFEEIIDYDQILNVSTNDKSINIEFKKSSQKKIINLRASSASDAFLIKDSISERISEHRRKLEVERSLRIKYKSGDFSAISPNDFEKVIGELFTYMGYSVSHVGGSGDGGIDLKCHNHFTGEKVIVQCKRYSGKVGIGSIRDFYGALIHTRADKGYVFTTSEFTKETKNWVQDKPIELVDTHKLSHLMMQYYK